MPREEWQKINTIQRKHPPKVDALHLYSIIISRIFAIVKGIYGYLWVFMGMIGHAPQNAPKTRSQFVYKEICETILTYPMEYATM